MATAIPLAPRRLSCLRIKRSIAETSARLDSRPAAYGYLYGIYTHMLTQPFFQVATTDSMAATEAFLRRSQIQSSYRQD